jgi:hypothetical protein
LRQGFGVKVLRGFACDFALAKIAEMPVWKAFQGLRDIKALAPYKGRNPRRHHHFPVD